MDYLEELEAHKGYQCLDNIRDWYREKVLLRWPEWMPGTKVLAWRLDKNMFLIQQRIENKIYSRRITKYREERYRLRNEYFDRIPIERFALAKLEAKYITAYKRSF